MASNDYIEGIDSDAFHPTRALRRWPDYADVARRHARNWGTRVTDRDMQALAEGLLPVMQAATLAAPLEERPKHAGVVTAHVEQAVRYGMLDRDGFNIYVIAPRVRNALAKTSLEGIRLGDIHVPYPTLYLGFEGGSGIFFGSAESPKAWMIEGAYIQRIPPTQWEDADLLRYQVCLTTRQRIGSVREEYRLYWPMQEEPHFTFTLSGVPDQTIEQAVGLSIESGDLTLEPDDDAIDVFRQGVIDAQPEAAAAGFEIRAPQKSGEERGAEFRAMNLDPAKQALSLVLGALCALADKERLASRDEQWSRDAPQHLVSSIALAKTPKAKRKAEAELKRHGFAPLRRIALGEDQAKAGLSGTGGGGEKSAHWRAGHFRRQRIGQGWRDTKINWILPVLVSRGKGDAPKGRIYKVDRKPGDETPPDE